MQRPASSGGGGAVSGVPGASVTVAAPAPAPVGQQAAAPAAPEPVEAEPAETLMAAAEPVSDEAALLALSSQWALPPTPVGQPRGGQLWGASAGLPGEEVFIGVARASYPLAGEINAANGGDALAAALDQPIVFSTVPDSATWITLIAGMALVGFSLRRRNRLPTVSN
jgi:hypothetical protein